VLKKFLLAVLAAAAFAGVAMPTASADPSDYCMPGYPDCHPISRPVNGYDPADPSGKGFLRGYGIQPGAVEVQPTGDAAYMQWLADRGLVLPNGAMSSVAGLGRIICSDLARNGSEPVESRAVANAAHIPSFRADLYVAGAHATLCPGTPVN